MCRNAVIKVLAVIVGRNLILELNVRRIMEVLNEYKGFISENPALVIILSIVFVVIMCFIVLCLSDY